jgi:DNA polymerase-3 subunit alpha
MKELNPNYVQLHTHSVGSLRDGIMKVRDHVQFAVQHKKKFVSISDHGSISEWIELYTDCAKEKIQPIYGIEGYIHLDRDKYLEEKNSGSKPGHILLLAQNEIGFKNIVRVHNDAWQHFYKRPIMSYDYLFDHTEGIIVGTACMGGTLSKYLIAKDIVGADNFIETMKEKFPNRFFVELMLIDMDEQTELNRQLIQIAKKHKVPVIVGNDPHYMTAEDNKAHQISLLLQSSQTVKDLESGKGWSFSAQDLWMKTEKDLYQDWKKKYSKDPIFTEEVFVEATWNVKKITDTIEEIYLEHPPRLPKYKNGKKLLEQITVDGFAEKVEEGIIPQDRVDEYIDRIKYELKTIDDLDLIDYFLLIKEIHTFCDKHAIAVGPGRGCFIRGSKVKTKDGYKNIEEVQIGDVIYNKNGTDLVVNKFDYEVDEDLCKLIIDGQEIICTSEHKFEVLRENKVFWIKAKNIKVDDMIVKIDTYQKDK